MASISSGRYENDYELIGRHTRLQSRAIPSFFG